MYGTNSEGACLARSVRKRIRWGMTVLRRCTKSIPLESQRGRCPSLALIPSQGHFSSSLPFSPLPRVASSTRDLLIPVYTSVPLWHSI